MPTRARGRAARTAAWLAGMLVVCVAGFVAGSPAASSSVIVTLDVASSTTLDLAACPPAAQTFGVLLPDTSTVTAAPCTIGFGSSNDTSMLKLYQLDGSGDAMFSRSNGTTMDTGFSAGGTKVITFPEGSSNAKFGLLQSDGSYVIGGNVTVGGDSNAGLARVSATGILDPAFGDGGTGRKFHDFAPTYDELLVEGITDSSGRIVAAGYRENFGAFLEDAMLVRFTDDGQFDPTFGGGDGVVVSDSAGWDQWWSVTELPTGRYATVGCSCGVGTGNVLVGRFNEDGTPDETFAPNGISERSWGSTSSKLQTLVPLPSGKFIVGGTRDNGAGVAVFIARINADLSLDTTYGTAGFLDFPTLTGIGRISQAGTDGSVWVTGHVDNSGGGFGVDIGVARTTPGGAIDTSWVAGGIATANYSGSSNDYGYSTLPLGGDSVLVTGGTTSGTGDAHATAFTAGTLDTSFSSDGRSSTDPSGGGFDFAVESFWGREGRIVSVGTSGSSMGMSVYAGGGTLPDYGGAAVFGSADTQAAFGACLEARTGAGVTGGWAVDPGGSCTTSPADPWIPIADDPSSPTAKVVASPTSGVADATATLRFGVKTALATPPGQWLAPMAIEVIAPNS